MRTTAACSVDVYVPSEPSDAGVGHYEGFEARGLNSTGSGDGSYDGDCEISGRCLVRRKLLAVEEAQYNMLLHYLLRSAHRRGVRQVCGDLIEAFSLAGTAAASGVEADVDAWLLQTDAMSGAGEEYVLPKVRVLHLSTYLGPRQLLVLSDLLQTVPTPHDAIDRRGANPPPSPPCTLLPLLEVLELLGMVARFPSSGEQPGVISEANTAFLALFSSLTGHPSLRRLNLTGTGIGPLLLPALQRFVRGTPALVEVVLDGTNLSESERACVAAVCQLNALRMERSPSSKQEEHPDELAPALERWLNEKARGMRDALRADVRDDLSWKRRMATNSIHATGATITASVLSPYVARICSESEADDALYALYGTRHHRRRASLQLSRGCRGPSAAEAHCDDGAASDASEDESDPSTGRRGNDESDGEFSDADAFDRATIDGATIRLAATGVTSAATSASPTLTLPFLHYRLPGDSAHVLTRECEEVLRAAFVAPAHATRTFLGGRAVPAGVPGPLAHLTNRVCRLSVSERASLKAALSDSALMRALHATLFPPLEKPRRVFHSCAVGPELRTTAEENYEDVMATQSRQWDLVVDKLVAFATPARLSRPGASLYEVGDAPYWLCFLAQTQECSASPATGAAVTLEYPVIAATQGAPENEGGALISGESGAVSRYTPLPGECFGEVELLAGSTYHAPALALLERRVESLGPASRRPKPAALLRQLCRAREAAAQVATTSTCSDEVRLWQFPLEVVFFLFDEPYAAMQRQRAATARLARAPGCPAGLSALFAALLDGHRVVRHQEKRAAGSHSLTSTSVASPGGGGITRTDGMEGLSDNAVAGAEDLQRFVHLLEEGEYTLRIVTPAGKMMERALLPGTVIVGFDVYATDAELRETKNMEGRDAPVPTGGLAVGTAVGKEAALREFREAKRRARAAAAATLAASNADAVGARAADAGGAPAAPHGPGEQSLYLGRPGAVTTSGVWQYYTLTAVQFAALPACMRLALTERSVVIEPLS